ncbi:hypothetical protein CC86DRAFT_151947 [Ophiobolus disseminans]|uniref:Uncharacterized protein n=1 Tax=Ophiobolus disseminans TaxID=1469910 RepID=A0A6A6ZDT8_9PLEO|nr:hypothetical protein CC86DRAFT_151947 [Ophiobolus disseminans]
MMNKLLTTGTALLAVASALPQKASTPAKTWYSLNQLARFENADGLPLVAASPINIYLDIFWQGMSLVQTGGLQNIAIVKPNSPSNYAAYSALDVATVAQGQPSMTVTYADSTIDRFDLHSFFYGCALGTQVSVLGVPQSCTISIKGYKDELARELVAEQSFSFTVAALQTNAQMVKASVSSKFKDLKRVNFFVSNDITTAALIDTVSYKVYSDKQISS